MKKSDAEATTAYVGIGSNLGDRAKFVSQAIASLNATEGVIVTACSPVYESEALVLDGQPPQGDFLNAVVEVLTTLAPRGLLDRCRQLEQIAGRAHERPRWSPRTLDLDILAFGDDALASPDLVIPHPEIGRRRFVLAPLADVAPGRVLPGTGGMTVSELLVDCPDKTRTKRLELATNE